MQVVSSADLYAGKIVAALDRQHPRDLFDVRDLLAKEGISEELRRAFLVYVVIHNRPIAEILVPGRKALAEEFEVHHCTLQPEWELCGPENLYCTLDQVKRAPASTPASLPASAAAAVVAKGDASS